MKKNTIFLLLFLASYQVSFSQKNLLRPEKSADGIQQYSPDKQPPVVNAASLSDALDAAFDSICNLSTLNGFNAAMILPDGTVWKRAHGLAAKIPVSVPLTTDHLMAMGSITKSFVATTLLTMVDDSLLSLDDSIGKFLAVYPNVPGYATVRQLLSHRTGISDYLNENQAMSDAWLANVDSIWVADTILNNYVLAPNFPVDADWSYSNTNYLLAGRIIENITGQPWYEAVRERVLVPAGLTHTFAYPWESAGSQPVAHIFADLNGDGAVDDVQGFGFPVEGLFSIASSAGCFISTPEDIAVFNRAVHSGLLLQPATLAEMHTDHGDQYGLGTFFLNIPGYPNWGHNGDLIYKSIGFYFNGEDMSLAVQQNDERENSQDTPEIIDGNDVFFVLLRTYINFEDVSAAAEPESDHSFFVFPNPASEHISVVTRNKEGNAGKQVQITDEMGRLVFSGNMKSNSFSLPVADWANGVYYIHTGGIIQKIVVQHP